MRVIVDWDLCQGHGVCEGEAPEVFAIEDDGDMKLLLDRPPEAMRKAVEAAREYCPQRALSIAEKE